MKTEETYKKVMHDATFGGRLRRLSAWAETLAMWTMELNLSSTSTEALVLADVVKSMHAACIDNLCSVPTPVLMDLARQVDEVRETCDRIVSQRARKAVRA